MAAADNKELAYANAIAVTREGIANGFVPNFVSASGFQSRDRSQPPVGSISVQQIYRQYQEWIRWS